MYSTAEDLLKFDQGIFQCKLFSKKTLDLMMTPYPELYGVAYGFWVTENKFGNQTFKVANRQGSIWGANANWLHLIDQNKTFIVLSNTNATNLEALTEQLVLVSSGQETTITSLDSYVSNEDLIKTSLPLNNTYIEVEFLLNALPDNGWFLKLHKDGTFDYIVWSGWGPSEGVNLEMGTYTITKNQLKLKSNNAQSKIANSDYFIAVSATDLTEKTMLRRWIEYDSKFYCMVLR
jgi:hypothetical protein